MADKITQTFSTPPSPPVAGTPTFDPDADACVSYFSTFIGEANAWSVQANVVAEEVEQVSVAATAIAETITVDAAEAAAARDVSVAAAAAATLRAAEAVDAAGSAAAHDAAAVAAADRAVAAAASVSKGTDPWQLVRAGDLGTNAWRDETWLYVSATWDAPSCAAAAQVSTAVAAPGAEIGDKVFPSASIALSGLNLRGEVTAADTVTLYLSNLTAAAVDLASATYYIAVLKRIPTR
jgi:hypothetical protein